MRILCFICGLFLLFSLTLGLAGCRREEDFLDVLRGGFKVELSGTLQGVAFSGSLVAEPAGRGEDGSVLPFAGVFTFYAPESLAGTVLARSEEGTLALLRGELALPLPPESGFMAIFDAFPTRADASAVKLTEEGLTEVQAGICTLSFLKTGEPIRVSTPALTAELLQFRSTQAGE